nr:MAG TPA: hypothetical protein [Caudoviricetes sp.]
MLVLIDGFHNIDIPSLSPRHRGSVFTELDLLLSI